MEEEIRNGINLLDLDDEEIQALEERWLAQLMDFMGY